MPTATASRTTEETVRRLLDEHGTTFADEAGIRVKDTPSATYQVLVLSVLSATRIRAEIAVAAARELFHAGYRTPRAMLDASWQDRVDALGRAHYKRYDESTSTALGRGAEMVLDLWHGDLRRLRHEADGDTDRLRAGLKKLPRIGDMGTAIFCREIQGVWPEIRPFVDPMSRRGAEALGLPTDPRELAGLVSGDDLPRFTAALVRASHGH